MARSILILDKYRSTRAKLKSFISSELGDTVVHEADTVDGGIRMFSKEDIHSLIIDDRLPGLERLHCKRVGGGARDLFHLPVPSLLVLTSDPRQATLDRYREQGFEHFLPTPFSAEALASRIDALIHPRRLRSHRRYHLDAARVLLRNHQVEIDTALINFSRSGLLCEMVMRSAEKLLHGDGHDSSPLAGMLNNLPGLRVTMVLPVEFRSIQVENLPCRLVGLKVMSWSEESLPERVRIELHIPEAASATLEILELALMEQDNAPLQA